MNSPKRRITVHRLKDLIKVLVHECEEHKATLDLLQQALDFVIAHENKKFFGKV